MNKQAVELLSRHSVVDAGDWADEISRMSLSQYQYGEDRRQNLTETRLWQVPHRIDWHVTPGC